MLEQEERKMSRKINETVQKAKRIMQNKKEKEDRFLEKLKNENEKKQKELDQRLKNFEERKRFINNKLD